MPDNPGYAKSDKYYLYFAGAGKRTFKAQKIEIFAIL